LRIKEGKTRAVTELLAYVDQLKVASPKEIEESFADRNKKLANSRQKLARLQVDFDRLDKEVKQNVEARSKIEENLRMLKQVSSQKVKQVRLRAGEFVAHLLSTAISKAVLRERETNLAVIKPTLSALWSKFSGRPETIEFSPRGEMFLVRDGTRLSFSQLSGGEKTALLIFSHTVASRALSNVDFLLIDEPLEHLDLENRRSLLSFIVQAARRD